MSKKFAVPISELFEALAEEIPAEDILSAKTLAQISTMIASKRIEFNMNQHDFAEFMGVKQAQISKWESGECNFTIKKLIKIAYKLNLDMHIFFSDSVQDKQANNIIRISPTASRGGSSTSNWKKRLSETDSQYSVLSM